MLEDDGFGKLGLYSNAAIYLGIAIGSLLSTGFLNKVGDINSMIIGSFMCVPFMGSFLVPSLKIEYYQGSESYFFSEGFIFLIIIAFSFLHGLSEALLFVAQGKYIADCATERNKGFFFSYFWAFYMSSQIVGNYIAAKVLGRMTQTAYILIMTLTTVVFSIVFVFLKPT